MPDEFEDVVGNFGSGFGKECGGCARVGGRLRSKGGSACCQGGEGEGC